MVTVPPFHSLLALQNGHSFLVILSLDAVFRSFLYFAYSNASRYLSATMKGSLGFLLAMVMGAAAGVIEVPVLVRRDAIVPECGKGHFGGVFKSTPHSR